MPGWPGFYGGSYAPRAYRADLERSINLIPEPISSGKGTNEGFFQFRPVLLAYLDDTGSDALFYDAATGRAFGCNGDDFVEINDDGTWTSRGTIEEGTTPPMMASNGDGGGQIGIMSNGKLWMFAPATNTLTAVTDLDLITDLRFLGFMDGYFLVLNDDGVLQWSALEDGLTWDALDFAENSITPDPWTSMCVSEKQVWLIGQEAGQVWTDSGDPDAPFAYVQGSLFQVGIVAPWSIARYDGGIVWLGRSEAGDGIVYRANSYVPQRLSTAGVEKVVADWGLAIRSLVRGIVFSWEGHLFYLLAPDATLLTSTTMNLTPVFDAASGLWIEWGQLPDIDDSTTWLPFPATCHCYAFGRHIFGNPSAQLISSPDVAPSVPGTFILPVGDILLAGVD